MKKSLLLGFSILIGSVGCASTNTTTTAPITHTDFTNIRWQLSQINNEPVVLEKPFVAPNLKLDNTLMANGHAGCNRYFGQAQFKDEKLIINGMAMTMMACPTPAMDMESVMNKALSQWNEMSISGDTMTLTNPDYQLTFIRQDKAQ